jgi:hypothetical protein
MGGEDIVKEWGENTGSEEDVLRFEDYKQKRRRRGEGV